MIGLVDRLAVCLTWFVHWVGWLVQYDRAHHIFEIGSDRLSVRVGVSLKDLGLGQGFVVLVSYTVCANHFLQRVECNPWLVGWSDWFAWLFWLVGLVCCLVGVVDSAWLVRLVGW